MSMEDVRSIFVSMNNLSTLHNVYNAFGKNVTAMRLSDVIVYYVPRRTINQTLFGLHSLNNISILNLFVYLSN